MPNSLLEEIGITEHLSIGLKKSGEVVTMVNGKTVAVCRFAICMIPIKDSLDVKSVDELIEKYSVYDMEEEIRGAIDPRTDLFVHHSNIKGWVDSGYNMNAIDSRIAFPILSELVEVDQEAGNALEGMMYERWVNGNRNSRVALLELFYRRISKNIVKYDSKSFQILRNVILHDPDILKGFLKVERFMGISDYLNSNISNLLYDMYYSNMISDELYVDLVFGKKGVWKLIHEIATRDSGTLDPQEILECWIDFFQEETKRIYGEDWIESDKCRDLNNRISSLEDCPSTYFSLDLVNFNKLREFDGIFYSVIKTGSVTEVLSIHSGEDLSKFTDVLVYDTTIIGRHEKGFEIFDGYYTPLISYIHEPSDEYIESRIKDKLSSLSP